MSSFLPLPIHVEEPGSEDKTFSSPVRYFMNILVKTLLKLKVYLLKLSKIYCQVGMVSFAYFVISLVYFWFHLQIHWVNQLNPLLSVRKNCIFFQKKYKSVLSFPFEHDKNGRSQAFTCLKSKIRNTKKRCDIWFKVNNKGTRTTLFMDMVLKSLLVTLNMFHIFFCCLLWEGRSFLEFQKGSHV